MRKERFFDRFLFIVITATAFLVSGIASTETVDEIKQQIGNSFHETDKYYSMKVNYVYYPEDDADIFPKNMESEESATNLSDDQFVDGKVMINLPFGFPLYDLNVTRVAVTKEGTIQSADPSVNWTIAPLKAKFGLTRCNISYFFQEKYFYVHWNNFRFNHEIFQEHEFRFQVRLGDNGDINFVYKEVPFNVKDLRDYCDFLGDKFGVMYTHQELFKVPPYKETYELGFSMDFKKYEVKKGTVVRFFPADWCMGQKNCYDCTETEFHRSPSKSVRCSWCPAIEKCSSTRDSLQHLWKENKCDIYHGNDPIFCHFDIQGTLRFYFVLLVLGVFMNLAISVICILLRDKIFKIVCCVKPSKRHRERIQSTNQPSQPDGNNLAEDQNNDQEDQEKPVIWDSDLIQKPATYV
ncbi:Hypothetical predicted protein [Cloeon dipterum]|uniref:Uncharacterized protein n=1 Tax=Cloeon dipterum TaxID=197152 RepID=A0A8S1DKJ0_9INSE|nr:Hypothetical predicted protein [Cloeon dipterum]